MRYPVRIYVKPYTGHKKKLQEEYQRRIEYARKIESHVNKEMEKAEAGEYHSFYAESLHLAIPQKEAYKILTHQEGTRGYIQVYKPREDQNKEND